jgi:hypothetical protein
MVDPALRRRLHADMYMGQHSGIYAKLDTEDPIP